MPLLKKIKSKARKIKKNIEKFEMKQDMRRDMEMKSLDKKIMIEKKKGDILKKKMELRKLQEANRKPIGLTMSGSLFGETKKSKKKGFMF